MVVIKYWQWSWTNWTLLTFCVCVVSFSISQLFVRHCNVSCALRPGLPATGPVSHVSSQHTRHPALAESQSGARARLSRHICDTRAIMVVTPGMFSEKDFCINCICEFYRECDGKKNIYFGNKFFWCSWLFLGKKRKIFYNRHNWANQRLMFDLNSRDGEYSKFELCSESSWSRGQAVWLWSSRARIRNRFLLCWAPRTRPASLPPVGRAQGAAAPAGELVQSAVMIRAQSLIRFCVRVFFRVNRLSQIANSAPISASWHSFSALTFAANFSTPRPTTSLSRKKFTFPRVPRHVWCGINSLNKINGPCDTERKLELCPRILFLFRNVLMTVKTVGVLGHNRCEQH